MIDHQFHWTKKCFSLNDNLMLFTTLLTVHWSCSSRAHCAVQRQRLTFGLAAMVVSKKQPYSAPAVNQGAVHTDWNRKIIWTGHTLTNCHNRPIHTTAASDESPIPDIHGVQYSQFCDMCWVCTLKCYIKKKVYFKHLKICYDPIKTLQKY